jgi:FkbM family methyltransferase
MAVIAPLLEQRTRGIDIGANVGAYTYFMAKGGLSVEAFEPIPACATALRAVECDRIRIHQLALSDKPGLRRLIMPLESGRELTGLAAIRNGAAGRDQARAFDAQCETLDSFGFKDVSLIKIDVEGHELAVLRGAQETLARDLPLIVLELELRHVGVERWQETLDWLDRRDYAGFFTPAARFVRPITEFKRESHQRLMRGAPVEPYVNNFVFVPRSHVMRFVRATTAWGVT